MACFHPLSAVLNKSARTGRNQVLFNKPGQPPNEGEPIKIPCGQCIGCRLDRSLQWAIRMVHEAKQHPKNCFVTLTYNPENLPADGSLCKPHFQKFMKRLRKNTGQPVRYFHCGEYGDQLSRPHYHAALFGIDFDDKELISNNQGNNLYNSPTLDAIWQKGYTTIGELTFESAAYVARYCTKKLNGEPAFGHYINSDGEQIQPEYATMSRNPGIARAWWDQFKDDVFPWDEVIHDGRSRKPPRYYDTRLSEENPEQYNKIKALRMEKALKAAHDNTPERLVQREIVKKSQFSQLKRNIEHDS